jgi:Flp pilus assembly protein TadD
LEPNNPSFLDSLAITYLKMGNFDQAITGYSAALLLDPGHPTSLYGRGITKQKKGDNAGGNADIEIAKK